MAPNHAGVRYNLGNALLQDGRPIEAVEAFISCLQLAPDFGAGYVNLANTLRQLASLEQAQAMAERAVQHLPDVPEAMICLANVLHEQAKYPEAAQLYRQVLNLSARPCRRSQQPGQYIMRHGTIDGGPGHGGIGNARPRCRRGAA